MPDLSRMTNMYVPRGSRLTFVVPFFNVMVKPGPTVPVSLRAAGGAVVDPAARVRAAAAATIRLSKVRVMFSPGFGYVRTVRILDGRRISRIRRRACSPASVDKGVAV